MMNGAIMTMCTEEVAEPWARTKDYQKEIEVVNSNKAQFDSNCNLTSLCPCSAQVGGGKEDSCWAGKVGKGGKTEVNGQRLESF